MGVSKKKTLFGDIYTQMRKKRLDCIKTRLQWKKKELEAKAEIRPVNHSILWVWEFSKKAVLVCFLFYIIVQLYSMTVMVITHDYTHLGDLITQAGEIVRDCVFGYFVKAGVENALKIVCSRKMNEEADG